MVLMRDLEGIAVAVVDDPRVENRGTHGELCEDRMKPCMVVDEGKMR